MELELVQELVMVSPLVLEMGLEQLDLELDLELLKELGDVIFEYEEFVIEKLFVGFEEWGIFPEVEELPFIKGEFLMKRLYLNLVVALPGFTIKIT